jgi:hypothetical protein
VQRIAEPVDHLARVHGERVPRRRRAVRPGVGQVRAHDLRRGRPDTRDLVVEARQRIDRDGRDEVRAGVPQAAVEDQWAELDAAQRAACPRDPRRVLRRRVLVVEDEHARDELPQRAQRKARAREVLVGELDADHARGR